MELNCTILRLIWETDILSPKIAVLSFLKLLQMYIKNICISLWWGNDSKNQKDFDQFHQMVKFITY